MSLHLTTADQPRLLRWAEERFGYDDCHLPPESEAVGVFDGETVAAVIVYNAHYGHYLSMHVATNGSRRWLTRDILAGIFGYAFQFKGATRINAVVSVKNVAIQILCLKLGFRVEATIRCGADDGTDGILFGMLADECPWLKPMERQDGQEKRTEA